jgi:hypothetical protein
VDHVTTYIHHRHQVSLRVGETLKTKHNFEKIATDNGVRITRYHADNAHFGARNFRAGLEIQNQELSLSGVGAHHQNGVAERAIQTSTKWARTILLHAILHWPHVTAQTNVLQLWPFAMDHSIHVWNNLLGKKIRRSPIELFTSTAHPNYDHLQRSHVWGSPMYVLQPELQDAKKIGKWSPRARRALYLGVSPNHSSSVALVLNLTTGFISPQFHVVHDDLFATVTSHWDDGTFDPDRWNTIIQSGQERYCYPSTRRHASARQRELPAPPAPPSGGGGYLNQPIYLTICLSIHRKLIPKLLHRLQVRRHQPLHHLVIYLLLILILIYLKKKIKITMKKLKSLYMTTSQGNEADVKFALLNA